MDRELLGYSILSAMLVGLVGFILFRRHYSRERVYDRRSKLAITRHDELMADRAAESQAQ